MRRPALHLAALLLFFGGAAAHAQIQVDIAIKRGLFIRYEPILATVSITNLSGNDIELVDEDHNPWFSIEVQTTDGRPIPPVGGTYANTPLAIKAGEKIARTINLTPLFPLSEFGAYRIRAIVYAAPIRRFFKSPSLTIEITDGRIMWQKTVGVPDGEPGAGTSRTYTLLSHRLSQSTQLYVRVEDTANGVVYCTHQLGRFLTFGMPEILLDRQNQLHVLQNAAPKTFLYSRIGLNGQVLDRKSFNEFSTRPLLRRDTAGDVRIVGGQEFDPTAPPPEQSLPTLGDRPVALPTNAPSQGGDKRPDNLLSR